MQTSWTYNIPFKNITSLIEIKFII
jgi:hypothetical protein